MSRNLSTRRVTRRETRREIHRGTRRGTRAQLSRYRGVFPRRGSLWHPGLSGISSRNISPGDVTDDRVARNHRSRRQRVFIETAGRRATATINAR